MHQALWIVEIVEMICSELSAKGPHLPSADARRALSSLARSAKVFHDPALDILWRHQNTIMNLIKCMPADLWSFVEDGNEDEERTAAVHLKRIIEPSDWERPLMYMHRVKSLSEETVFKTPELLETLSVCLPGAFLFPSLEILSWYPNQVPSTFHHIRWFLTPHIRELTIGCHTLSQLSILSNLASLCPLVSDISIWTELFAKVSLAAPAVSTFVLGLPQIKSLQVPSLDSRALLHLAHDAEPARLYLAYALSPQTLTDLTPYLEAPGFHKLAKLTVRTMKCALRILDMMENSSLKTLEIMPTSWDPTEVMSRDFYRSLRKHCSHSALRNISVEGQFGSDARPLSANETLVYSVGRDALHPLFAFTQLVQVQLAHPVGFDLDDATVLEMARAWPHVEDLSLSARPHRHVASRVTLEGIYAFAKHCPRLQSLAMTFDASVVPKLRDNGRQRVTQKELYYLNVAGSPVTQPRRVAKFLSAIFPSLLRIGTLRDDLGDELSSDGEDLIQALAAPDCSGFWVQIEDDLHH
ncbi:hypothetical protein DFH06DRAFT_749359 [Mycena polygramma]|nr:hypothetical protein DFH06DRAFT_749359 [Mycena polygramma]